MERFVFVAAVTIAIIFGIGAVFGGGDGWHFEFDDDGDMGRAELVELAPGSLAATAFAGDRLRLRSVAAVVTITPEDRTDFLIEIDNSAGRVPMPEVSVDEDRVTINGHLRGRIGDCGPDTIELRGYDDVAAADLPRITIRAPRALVLDRSGAGTTEIGAAASIDADFNGCGSATIGDVEGELNVDMTGSGTITTGAAGSLDADLTGSGDIAVGAVANGASVDVMGSGSVTIASLNGEFSADGPGSGTVTVLAGAITSARVDVTGSGGAVIGATVQSLDVEVMGSGDVDVSAAVGSLDAQILGSGDVTVTAPVGSIDAEIMGSGDVSVASVTGTIRRQELGSGTVRVGATTAE